MGAIEDHIIHKAHEFDRTGDWPQPFDAFVPVGETAAHTVAAIHGMQHEGRLTVADFEASGMAGVEVVLGLGPKV